MGRSVPERIVHFEDLDVITSGTCGLMSGTYAVLSFQFSEPNRFVKASQIYFNGVEGYAGPCPNERIGIIDAIVHGTKHSRLDSNYGGGHLFKDIVGGEEIAVEVLTDEGKTLSGRVTIDQMPHAMLHGSRHAFRNYVGFVNPGKDPIPTIFCSSALPPNYGGATACGCGELNPLQKDPGLRTIGVGTRVMLNGGKGFVVGLGTRSSIERPCLSVVADMHTMNPDYMGGFQTSAGPEVIQTWAVPIPILDETVLRTAKTLDEEIPRSCTFLPCALSPSASFLPAASSIHRLERFWRPFGKMKSVPLLWVSMSAGTNFSVGFWPVCWPVSRVRCSFFTKVISDPPP